MYSKNGVCFYEKTKFYAKTMKIEVKKAFKIKIILMIICARLRLDTHITRRRLSQTTVGT